MGLECVSSSWTMKALMLSWIHSTTSGTSCFQHPPPGTNWLSCFPNPVWEQAPQETICCCVRSLSRRWRARWRAQTANSKLSWGKFQRLVNVSRDLCFPLSFWVLFWSPVLDGLINFHSSSLSGFALNELHYFLIQELQLKHLVCIILPFLWLNSWEDSTVPPCGE